MKMVYFSYPYTDNPTKRTEEIKCFVRILLMDRKDIVPIIPHLTFDSLYDYPKGYDNSDILLMELEIISRCDVVAFNSREISVGVLWELAFAKWLGKEIKTFEEMLRNEQTRN